MLTNGARERSFADNHLDLACFGENVDVGHDDTQVAVLFGKQEAIECICACKSEDFVVANVGLDFRGDLLIDGSECKVVDIDVGDFVGVLSGLPFGAGCVGGTFDFVGVFFNC